MLYDLNYFSSKDFSFTDLIYSDCFSNAVSIATKKLTHLYGESLPTRLKKAVEDLSDNISLGYTKITNYPDKALINSQEVALYLVESVINDSLEQQASSLGYMKHGYTFGLPFDFSVYLPKRAENFIADNTPWLFMFCEPLVYKSRLRKNRTDIYKHLMVMFERYPTTDALREAWVNKKMKEDTFKNDYLGANLPNEIV